MRTAGIRDDTRTETKRSLRFAGPSSSLQIEASVFGSSFRRQAGRDTGCGHAALWMTPAALAHTLLLPKLRRNVVDDVVGSDWITGHACGHVVQGQIVTRPPCYVVISA